MEVATLFVLSATTLPAQAPRPVIVPGNTVLLAAYNCAADQLARADAIGPTPSSAKSPHLS